MILAKVALYLIGAAILLAAGGFFFVSAMMEK